MENPVPQVPTLEQLKAQLNNLILQRAGMKDQLDVIEKQMPVLHGMIQLLETQAANKAEVTED